MLRGITRWVCPLQASLGTLIMVTGRCSTSQYNQDPNHNRW